MTRALLPALLLLALGACVPKPAAAPPVPQRTVIADPVRAAPPAAVGWEDRARTPGDWRYAVEGGKPTAEFGAGGGVGRLIVQCERAQGRVTLVAPGLGGTAVTITTTSLTRTVQGSAAANAVQISLPAGDPLWDAMIYSRGRFMVSPAGTDELIVPAWPELNRVVDDCRG